MIIDRNLNAYVVLAGESIAASLKKIIATRGQIVLAVTEGGHLEGLFTNGDFVRWVSEQREVDLTKPISTLLNRDYICVNKADPPDHILQALEQVDYVPVVDDHNRLVGVARRRSPHEGITIAGRSITESEGSVFIIAEIGINHNGSLSIAKQLIDGVAEANVDCAKFQMRNLEALYRNLGDADDVRENIGSQYTLDILSRSQLSEAEMFEAFDYCREKGLVPLCTPWDLESLAALERYGVDAYKIASPDMTNLQLIEAACATGKPLICSTGMSTEGEIRQSVRLLRERGAQYVLLHCNSTYPAPFKDVNLKYLDRLREIGDCVVGYSGHERDIYVGVAAVARGARVVEKHITLDRNMEGNDHKVSLLPDEFGQLVDGIRQVEHALGSATVRTISQGERINRATLAKSLVAACTIRKGQVLDAQMISVKGPGQGLQPNRLDDLLGITAQRDMEEGEFFYPSDLEEVSVLPRAYSFTRPWGVPVRFHDYKSMLERVDPNFLEFHLSFKDLEVPLDQYFDNPCDMNLVVHSPDFFTGDHLLDLASDDPVHLERSLREFQAVIEMTRRLAGYFRGAWKPLLVASVGGFSRSGFVPASDRPAMYERIAQNLGSLDTEGVEIIPQTLPPFPWYFGGQLYLNVFVDAASTVQFCRDFGYRLCLDVSHAKLACNHYGWSYSDFIAELAPYAAHLHIADGAGVDGEGLQVGEGEIDFAALGRILREGAAAAPFIPEIWQGHEDEGRGFWIALDRLEEVL